MLNKVILITLALLAVNIVSKGTSDIHIFNQFQQFVQTYNKNYGSPSEFQERFEIFKMNYQKIYLLNQEFERTEEYNFGYGVTQFFDMTPEEFAKTHLNLNISTLERIKERSTKVELSYAEPAPESFDWREKGVVSLVKNQGSCGSCWAFSAIGNIEARHAIKNHQVTNFSEQQLVDCDEVDQGCNGGLMEEAYKYLENTGVMAEADYTYKGRKGKCQFNADKVATKVTGFEYVAKNEEEIKQALYEHGPFAIAINATPLQFYFGGIFNPWFSWICNPKGLNHGVLLVGYGVKGNKKYWIIKNSWGSGWGEKGYYRLIAGKGACGVDQYVISAKLE